MLNPASRTAPLVLALVVVAGCPAAKQSSAQVKAVTEALDKRFGVVTDFTLEGTAEQGTEKLPYGYAMKQPTFVRASIGSNVITFDGKALLVVDTDKKTADRRDLAGVDDAAKLMMLHQAFSPFVCEGWRPPLLRPSGFTVEQVGATWHVTVPVDDATVKEQRLVLQAPSAELVEKTIVDKAGNVMASTKVTEELTDPGTRLVFPKAWQSGDLKIHVDKAAVNAGISAELFKTDVPAGYSAP